MPGRDLAATLKLLAPMVSDPNLAKKVDQAAPPEKASPTKKGDLEDEMVFGASEMAPQTRSIKVRGKLGDSSSSRQPKQPVDRRPPTPLEQVVGVILGSPEFQRR
jgi:hypothetical protein